LRIRVNPDDYLDKLVDYSMIKIYAIATVKETQQTWSEEDDFTVEKPQLTVNVRGEVQVGREYGLEIQFSNPINRVLQDCAFTIEAPGLTRPMQIKFRDIQPGESISHVLRFVPQRAGPRTIVVVFHSRQLIDVVGSKQVMVHS
jgi:transglutaminase 1